MNAEQSNLSEEVSDYYILSHVSVKSSNSIKNEFLCTDLLEVFCIFKESKVFLMVFVNAEQYKIRGGFRICSGVNIYNVSET